MILDATVPLMSRFAVGQQLNEEGLGLAYAIFRLNIVVWNEDSVGRYGY